MKLEAMKRQGSRTDLTLSQNETKSRSDEVLSKQVGESRAQAKGTVKLERGSNSSKKIIDAVENLYLRIADRYTGIRRIEVCANRVSPENFVQYSLFDDPKQTDKHCGICHIKRQDSRICRLLSKITD